MVRHRHMVCAACRRRKSKCDGGSPRCSACVAANSPCQYDKAPSIAYVRTLQKRIEELESRAAASISMPVSSSLVEPTPADLDDQPISLNAGGHVSYHNSTSAIHETPVEEPMEDQSYTGSLSVTNELNAAEIRRALVLDAATQKTVESLHLEASLAHARIPKEVAENLMRLHWCWLHPSFLFVYRPAFTRHMSLLNQQAAPYCTVTLIKVLYAHSCRFLRDPDTVWSSDNHGETFRQVVDRLTSEAKVALAMETLNQPCIPTIQALLQQSAREIACGNSSAAWLYSGMAFRMAIDLGIHVSPDILQSHTSSFSPEDIEIRKRLFWSLYAWDKNMSLYLGRMPNFLLGADTMSRDFLDDFSEQEPWTPFYWGVPEASELPAYPPVPGQVISCFKSLCTLCRILARIMLELYSFPTTNDKSVAQASNVKNISFVSIKNAIDTWWSNLPPSLRILISELPSLSPPPHVTSLNLMYNTTLILLHRPRVGGNPHSVSPAVRQSWEICRNATTSIYKILNLYVNTFGFQYITYMNSYCTYTAATTAVYQLETSQETSWPAPSEDVTWTELRFFLDILQRSATAMPGLQRSIQIIHTRVKKIFDRQVQTQLNSLFGVHANTPGQKGRGSTNQNTPTMTPFPVSESRTVPNYKQTEMSSIDSSAMGQEAGQMTELWPLEPWLPAFPGQETTQDAEIMLGLHGMPSLEAPMLVGSSLDSYMRLDPSLTYDMDPSYGPYPNDDFIVNTMNQSEDV